MEPMKYMKLEGNYIVAFRDTAAECLPAFTAVRFDRSKRRMLTGTPESSPTLRRRVSPQRDATLVITGVPSYVSLDIIRSRLEDCIPGVVRVYRERQTSTLPRPPIFVQTNKGIAVDAFMLRSEWIGAVDRAVENASAKVPQIIVAGVDDVDGDEDDYIRVTPTSSESELDRDRGLCPHGSYLAAGTCLQCLAMKGRRSTFISDVQLFRVDRKGSDGNVSPPLKQKSIGGLYELKQRRRSSYEIPVLPEDVLKSR